MSSGSFIAQNLKKVRERLDKACRAAGRAPETVTLLAVGKTFPPAALIQALAAGQHDFGENYLQEALPKIVALCEAWPREHVTWHFIGPVQSNKCGDIARHFDWLHTVDRIKIAQRLSQLRPPQLSPLNVCVQVNISGEASKSGVAPDQAAPLCRAVAALPRLRLRGLMAIPAPLDTPLPSIRAFGATRDDRAGYSGQAEDAAREPYRQLRALFEHLRSGGLELDTLSAGMSDDLEAAIAEGSTMVRIGTAIFGKRQP